MWKDSILLLNLLFIIFTYIYLFNVYKDSENDPSKIKFGFEEKKNFFKTMNKIPGLQFSNDCYYYQDLLMEKKIQKLDDFFKFNIESIHKGSFILLIFLFYFVLIMSINALFFLALLLSFIFPNFVKIAPIILTIFIKLTNVGKYLAFVNLISFIYLIHAYYSSDINSYINFLSCENVNVEGFKKYKSIENLKYDFTNFVILMIISLVLNIIHTAISLNEGREN